MFIQVDVTGINENSVKQQRDFQRKDKRPDLRYLTSCLHINSKNTINSLLRVNFHSGT